MISGFATGGVSNLFRERPGFKRGTKQKQKEKWRLHPDAWFHGDRKYPAKTYRPYKSKEDIPPKVLEMLMKDPNFDINEFLKINWAAEGHTLGERKYRGEEKEIGKLPLGAYSNVTGEMHINVPKFSGDEKKNVPAPFLDFDRLTDMEKATLIMHELRHKRLKEDPELKVTQPEWVQENPRGVEYPGVEYKEYEKGFIPDKYLTGHELYNWYLDKKLFPPREGPKKEWYPYYDKILRDLWDPSVEKYKRILEERKEPDKGVEVLAAKGGLIPGYATGGVSNLFRSR